MKPRLSRKAPAAPARDTLLVLLPEGAAAPVDWWRLDPAGRCIDQGTGKPGPAAMTQHDGHPPRVVVAVGAGCAVHWFEVRAHSVAQATAAAHARLAGDLASGVDGLHVAVAAGAGDEWLAAVTTAAEVQLWLGRGRDLGLEPEHLVPAALLLPAPGEDPESSPPPVLAAEHRGRWLCRGTGLVFTAEAALGPVVLKDRQVSVVELNAELLAAGALAPPLNLLQGAFASASDFPRGAVAWRWSAMLATGVLGLFLLAPGLRAGIDDWQAGRLAGHAEQEARAALPALPAGVDPLDVLHGQVAAARNVLDFSAATAGLMASAQAVPGISLDALSWQAGRLQATVAHGGTADLEALRAQLEAHGFALVEESRSAAGGEHMRLSLEPTR